RLAPENPHPAQLEDCVSVYKRLLSEGTKAENIVVGGDSAGGNLTLTTLLHLRDKGLPLPAGAVLLAPATDLTLSDESYFENGETDPILSDVGIFWWLACFISETEAKDPSISPLFAELKGLPPLLFQVSTSEMLHCDTTRFVDKARKAGVDVTMEAWHDTFHVFQSSGLDELPESKEALDNIGSFVAKLFE
ncbi:MAG: alpha/beta hydrolase, partial [Proteobacteria bacterium]|nr:alpha/beta hydrolase [Pseudomonadota bacterium]